MIWELSCFQNGVVIKLGIQGGFTVLFALKPCRFVELIWGEKSRVNLAQKKNKHVSTPTCHIIAQTNGGWGFANGTKLQSVKSNFSNFRM